MKLTNDEKMQRLEGQIAALTVAWWRLTHALDVSNLIEAKQIEEFLDWYAEVMDLTVTPPDHSLSKQQYLRSLAEMVRKDRLKRPHSADQQKMVSAVSANDEMFHDLF